MAFGLRFGGVGAGPPAGSALCACRPPDLPLVFKLHQPAESTPSLTCDVALCAVTKPVRKPGAVLRLRESVVLSLGHRSS